ncbi:MAG: hypothetical protein NZ772_02480 [Cyanobacteria bacterium]|nr:hypothetical protein [Cyanobacteriota bacterium]MDW8200382.1 hypothetical protein [Cyanobacteriota bacterium SKYGB_h_bin112]
MAQLPLVEMARQGDEWAIATLLNQRLKAAGYTARVRLENTCLQVIVESLEPPSQRSAVALVGNVLQRLSIAWAETIVISGKATTVQAPVWQETLSFSPLASQAVHSSSASFDNYSPPHQASHRAMHHSPSLTQSLSPPERLRLTMPHTSTDFLKLGFMGFLTVYAIAGLTAEDYSGAFTFLHGVDLIIHEAGHVVFSIGRIFGETFLGELIYFAGGSLLQIIVPAAIVGNFLLSAQYYAAAVALYWLAQNFTDVAIYIKDASAMELPLLAEGLIHDWNYILGSLNLLNWDQAIGGVVHFIGVLLFITAISFGVFCVIGQRFLYPQTSARLQ